jgi:hypothetical protein
MLTLHATLTEVLHAKALQNEMHNLGQTALLTTERVSLFTSNLLFRSSVTKEWLPEGFSGPVKLLLTLVRPAFPFTLVLHYTGKLALAKGGENWPTFSLMDSN